MPADRLRSIVPMFGGATQYVETLDAILEFAATHQPTTDELVGWHRGTFARVSSRESIMRRVSYLRQVGFIQQDGDQWTLGETGREYVSAQDAETLLRIIEIARRKPTALAVGSSIRTVRLGRSTLRGSPTRGGGCVPQAPG